MVAHIIGKLGSGKTAYGVQRILDLLCSSEKVIVTNIRLIDFWDYAIANYKSKGFGSFIKFLIQPYMSLSSFKRALAYDFGHRYVYFNDLELAIKYCNSLPFAQEGSRLLIWDEIHLDINARLWKSTSLDLIKFFSMSRKLGFDVLFISQLKSAVDRQMRDLADCVYELKNLQYLKFFGFSLMPRVGLLVKRWSNKGSDNPASSVFLGAGIVRYNTFVTSLYDTQQLLTDKTVTPPLLWALSVRRQACDDCAYIDYYRRYSPFVYEFYPHESFVRSRRSPRRILGSIKFSSEGL